MNDPQQDIIERLARIETHLEKLVGNGQPGVIAKLGERIDAAERDIDAVERDMVHAKGIYAGVSFAISVAVTALSHLWRSRG